MSDKTFSFDLTVEEMEIASNALKDYWASKVQAVAGAPNVVRQVLGPGLIPDERVRRQAQLILGEEERKWTKQARIADALRQRIEPIVEEHTATTRIDTTAATRDREESTACGGGGGL